MKEEYEITEDKEHLKKLKNQINDVSKSRTNNVSFQENGSIEEKEIYDNEFLKRTLFEDIYSLGILCLHCVEFIPFKERTKKLSEQKLKYIFEIFDQIYSRELKELIQKMVVEDPNERISLTELQDEINKIQNNS